MVEDLWVDVPEICNSWELEVRPEELEVRPMCFTIKPLRLEAIASRLEAIASRGKPLSHLNRSISGISAEVECLMPGSEENNGNSYVGALGQDLTFRSSISDFQHTKQDREMSKNTQQTR